MGDSLLWLGAVLLLTIILCAPGRSKPGLQRLGRDPGLFGLKIWFARLDFLRNGQKIIEDSYSKGRDTNYVVQTLLGDQVILAPRFLPELRMLPESSLNATAALVESVLGSYSGVDILLNGHLSSDICRGPLTKNMPAILPQMIDELDLVKSDLLGKKGIESPFVAYDLIYTLVSRISSRAFVGAPLCYDKGWIEAVNAFPMDVEKVKFALMIFPDFMRPWIVSLLPQKHRLVRNHRYVRNLLFPASKLAKTEEESTVLNLLLQSSKDTDPETLASRMILLTAAAFHNSSMATVQVLFNLCAMPDYLPALKLEAQAALEDSGGVWNMESLKNLQKLDSFFKESQRVNASTFLGFDRKVMSTIKLSDGTVIDAGETIAMPSGAMSQDHSYYTDPSKFDGYRFCHVTAEVQDQSPESEKEYTEIEPGNLSWGHGRFSCPGRWYASAVMKLLLATLILEYDFKFPDGQSTRPANYVMDVHVLPDMKQQVLFKKR